MWPWPLILTAKTDVSVQDLYSPLPRHFIFICFNFVVMASSAVYYMVKMEIQHFSNTTYETEIYPKNEKLRLQWTCWWTVRWMLFLLSRVMLLRHFVFCFVCCQKRFHLHQLLSWTLATKVPARTVRIFHVRLCISCICHSLAFTLSYITVFVKCKPAFCHTVIGYRVKCHTLKSQQYISDLVYMILFVCCSPSSECCVSVVSITSCCSLSSWMVLLTALNLQLVCHMTS